ncbi:acetyl-CoA acetyltransferase [Thermoplasma volcanium GSS1]|uniref:Acetyl-CoA acetyltransferase n=1 Tax=Thermoplasma volcanium (strain ATCC 51530 / DSM 4299 / JCM 9571 / NBRC 15438 / GSS1) TaxID=273116 RepID=Q978T8_THEVO|nr:acetyl-CoA C-acetyltransferase [Thermoplasma volcanium]BAB60469.1 acetyl-CoA acetyltransferase [Thermoplasma volcanium GSS1]
MENENVYLVDFKRTAFSRSRPNDPERDVFNSLRMDEAMAKLINIVIDETGIRPEEINDVITGCALQQDENWTYGGRHPILLANLPDNVPGMALDRACSSSLNAITIGAMEIMTGNADIVMAGGYEHMTHVPMSNSPFLKPNVKLLVRPEYMHYDMNTGYSMGLTAEKLASLHHIGREEMDQYALRSHQLASKALDDGYFKGEIVPMEVEIGGETKIIDSDQSIRKNTSLEEMQKLRPAFKDDGVITAGNSSPLNAGASLTLLMSEKKVKEYGLKPLSRIVSFGWAGVDPSIMGEGPVPATQKALAKAGMKVEDIDYWEINEAFAVVVLNAMKELGIEENKVNIHGGGISIGHPLGATGARIAGTLSRILNEKQAEYGVATLCVGGGQGYSVIFERY